MTELIRAKEATITLMIDGVSMSTHDVRDLSIVHTIPDPDHHRDFTGTRSAIADATRFAKLRELARVEEVGDAR